MNKKKNSKKSVGRNSKNKKQSLPKAKYEPIITTCASVTQQQIENICAHVEEGQFLETACLLENVLPKAFKDLMTQKYNKRSELSRYASDSVAIATARAEAKFINTMLDAKNFNGTQINAIKDFLITVNPKFHSKYQRQINYEISLLLDVVKKNVSEEQFLNILDELRSVDVAETLVSLDEKLQ